MSGQHHKCRFGVIVPWMNRAVESELPILFHEISRYTGRGFGQLSYPMAQMTIATSHLLSTPFRQPFKTLLPPIFTR